MRRDYDDEDARPNWAWRLTKGLVAGVVVCGAAAAALSIYVLPPPAPPPGPVTAGVGADETPGVIDGIEVSSEPAYFGVGGADEADGNSDAASVTADLGELAGPALLVNAEPYEAAPDQPLLAVMLADAAADPMLHESLFATELPISVGVVAGGPGDAATARAARAAGFEVVAELAIAQSGAAGGAALEYGLGPEEATDRTLMLLNRLPMAVAATAAVAAPAPPDGGVLRGILSATGPLGFAWLEHGVAPGARPAVASDGVELIVGVSRHAIPPGASAAEALAVLDTAAAAAADSGAALVVAPAEAEVLLALQLWGADTAGGLARLAPVSAVIRRQNGGDMPLEATPPPETAEAPAAPDMEVDTAADSAQADPPAN